MNTQDLFPLEMISTEKLLGKPVNTMDLGAIGRGLFVTDKMINIASLQPRQTEVFGGTLNYKMSGKGFTIPCVVITKSGNILIDGHHTVIVKKMKGQKSIKAKCYIFN